MLNSKKDSSGRYLYEVSPGRWVSRQRVHQLRNLKAHRARAIITAALRIGTLKRKPCEVCGEPNSQVHHFSYENPFSIQWLCQQHHNHPRPHLLEGLEIRFLEPMKRSRWKWIPPTA